MDIRRTQPDGLPKTGAERLRDAPSLQGPKPTEAKAAPPAAPKDHVELSPDALALSQFTSDRVPAGSLTPDRARVILDRMSQGFYDDSRIVDETLRRLAEATGQDGSRG